MLLHDLIGLSGLLFPLLAVATKGSTGCDSVHPPLVIPGEPSQAIRFHTAHGGKRSFNLHIPAAYQAKEPVPLILAFHGKNQAPTTFENETQLSNPAFNDEAIVAFPQGVKEQWTGDPAAPPLTQLNDLLYTSDLLDYLQATHCIDLDRIYAYGFSNGGGLVDLLACNANLAPRIAAFAATSAAVYQDKALKEPLFSLCPSRESPVPFLTFHGTSDPVIDYDGYRTSDGPSWPVQNRMQGWAERNGCPNGAENSTIQLFGGKVQKYSWTCDDFEDVVVHYRIEGFGHGVPTTTPLDNDGQRYGPTFFNATPIVMDFFRAWPLPEPLPELSQDTRDEL